MVGTSYYVAPEVLDGKYGFECDCWSLGVIMYVLLSGHYPFSGKKNSEIFPKIRGGPISFVYKEFSDVSESAKDLIMRLMERDTKLLFNCS